MSRHTLSLGNGFRTALIAGLFFVTIASVPLSSARAEQRAIDDEAGAVDKELLAKVQALYPGVELERNGDTPFFASVREVVRIRIPNDGERLVVWTMVTAPAARVDHGRGELLIYRDIDDEAPLVRLPAHALGILRDSQIRVIDNRWLECGVGSALIPLDRVESLTRLNDQGTGDLLAGLARDAVNNALDVYFSGGRETFLKDVPIAAHRSAHVTGLPEKIIEAELLPTTIDDLRLSDFRYSDAWEASIFVRVRSPDPQQAPVIVEIGARAPGAGVEWNEVELFVWMTLTHEPIDRPQIGPIGGQPLDIPISQKVAKKSDQLHVQLDSAGEDFRVIVWMPYPCGKGELVRPGFRSLRTGWSYDDLNALGPGEHRIENRRPRRARIVGPGGVLEL